MPVLMGLGPRDVICRTGVEFHSHPLGVRLSFQERSLVREYWERYYPHWQIRCPCPAARLVGLLQQKNLSLAVAESCSGGGISSAITDVPGASSVFWGGAVAYSAEAKVSLLGVDRTKLPSGCVGADLSSGMAELLRQRYKVDLGLAVTGALGPDTPAPQISVGEVYIAVAGRGHTAVRRFNFCGDRQTIKKAVIAAGINFLLTYCARWYVAGPVQMD